MSSTQASTERQRDTSIPAATTVDLKLEAIPIPASTLAKIDPLLLARNDPG